MTIAIEAAALAPRLIELPALEPFWPAPPEIVADDDLEASIAALGLLRPLLAWETGGGLKLLGGRRRLSALAGLGRAEAPAIILPPEAPAERALALGLADNRDRELNAAEQALTWKFLTDRHPEAAAGLAPLLGLGQSPKLRQWALASAALPRAGLAALAEGRLDLEIGARLAVWPPADQAAALALFEALTPSKQKKKQWLDWLEDISRRESLSPAAVLSSPELADALALAPRQGKPAAETEARRLVWKRRHPLLAALTGRREARLKALALPPSAKMELDPTLEDVRFTLNLTFTGAGEYRELTGLLQRLADSPDFLALLDDRDDQ